MKIDTSGLDLTRLVEFISGAYGIPCIDVRFFPQGEVGYHYVGTTSDGRRFFIRVQETARAAALEPALAGTAALVRDCNLWQAVAACPTLTGAFTSQLAAYTIAIFPFLDSRSAFERPLSDHELHEVAMLVARVHQSVSCLRSPLHAREHFAHPFGAPIRRALGAAERLGRDASPYQRRLRTLLLREQATVIAFLEQMDGLQAAVGTLAMDWVVTHGDPNLANILIDHAGAPYLIDWEEIALGPRERDLAFFTGERFEPFLRAYLAAAGSVRLDVRLFQYYLYRWTLQEIADWSTRILVSNTVIGEDEHSWAELRQYLPLPVQRLRASVAETERTLGRLLS